MTITVTDLFCGAGGSSTGAVQVPGVRIRMAANHWQLAVDTHNTNHPGTDHACVDLHQEDPRYFPRTDVLWASPECTKWSQANATKRPAIEQGLFEDPLSDEAAQRSRLLMFDVLRFAEHHRYRAMIVENVVDIAVQAKYALAWQVWRQQLRSLGYQFRVVSLNSMHAQTFGAPAPQSRDRIYIVAWRDGTKAPDLDRILCPKAWCPKCERVVQANQSWKNGKTVGRYRQTYLYVHGECGTVVEPGWLPAASAIDWSIPGERIGDRLTAKTRARIAAGIARYWGPLHIEAAGNTYDSADPSHRSYGDPNGYYRAWPVEQPLRSLHTTPSKAMVVPSGGTWNEDARPVGEPLRSLTTREAYGVAQLPFVAELRGGGSDARPVTEPAATFCASGNHHGLVNPPFILDRRGEYRVRELGDPLSTITANDTTKALISPYYGNSDHAKPVDQPVGTLTSIDRYALVQRMNGGGAEMTTPAVEYLRTLTTKGHQALIQAGPRGGRPLVSPADMKAAEAMVSECLFRMFQPHEVAAGMAFPSHYKWPPAGEDKVTKRDLVKMAGNAVTPPAARDLIAVVAESLGGPS